MVTPKKTTLSVDVGDIAFWETAAYRVAGMEERRREREITNIRHGMVLGHIPAGQSAFNLHPVLKNAAVVRIKGQDIVGQADRVLIRVERFSKDGVNLLKPLYYMPRATAIYQAVRVSGEIVKKEDKNERMATTSRMTKSEILYSPTSLERKKTLRELLAEASAS